MQAAAAPAADAAAAPAAGAPVITFPDDYPNSVRHFLLIGFLVSACNPPHSLLHPSTQLDALHCARGQWVLCPGGVSRPEAPGGGLDGTETGHNAIRTRDWV